MTEQTFKLETGLHSLASSSIAQRNALDEFRNESYIINLYMLWAFSNISWQLQLEFFHVQTSYQLIEKRLVFYSSKISKTIHTTYSRLKFTMHIRQYNITWCRTRKDKEVDKNLTFQERTPNVLSLLLEQYNGTIQLQCNLPVSRKVLSDNKVRFFCSFWNIYRLQLFLKLTFLFTTLY